MKKNHRIIAFFLLIGFLLNNPIRVNSYSNPDQKDTSGLRVLSSSNNEIILDFNLPAITLEHKAIGGETCQQINIKGYSYSGKPGELSLPASAVLLAIPPVVDLKLEVSEAVIENIPLGNKICRIDELTLDLKNSTEHYPAYTILEKGGNTIAKNASAKLEPVTILQQGFVRTQPVAQIGIYPIQYDPVTGNSQLYRSFKLRLSFTNQGIKLSKFAQAKDEGSFETLLQTSLLNYEQGKQWRVEPVRDTHASSLDSSFKPGYKLMIENEGIFEVTYSDLKAAGVPVDDIDPRYFHLSQNGVEMPIVVVAKTETDFTSGDLLRFYGWPAENLYTRPNIFLLQWDSKPGLRVIQESLPNSGDFTTPLFYWDEVIHDVNSIYLGAYPNGPDNDHWYQTLIRAPHATQNKSTYILTVNPVPDLVVDPNIRATIYAQFEGLSADTEHHIKLSLNGTIISDEFYDGRGDVLIEAKFHPSLLVAGDNALVVETFLDNGITSSLFYVNKFKLVYPAVFKAQADRFTFTAQPGTWLYQIAGFTNDQIELYDITDQHNPRLIDGYSVVPESGTFTVRLPHSMAVTKRYLIQTLAKRLNLAGSPENPLIKPLVDEDLLSPPNGADYLVITSPPLRTQAEALAAYRTQQGLRTRVINVQSIYDAFNFGLPDPNAIKGFIKYAYENWPTPAPLYVLLFGDGNYDYRNYLNRNEYEFVPPILDEYDPWVSETPSDNAYVSIFGPDNLPDLYVGRLPVKTPAEGAAALSKINLYESSSPGEWVKQTLFVTDNPDSGGDFYASSNALAGLLPGEYTVNKVYLGQEPYLNGTAAKNAIKSNYNAGRGLSIYTGHATLLNWASEQIFATQDVATLSATTQFPFHASLDCFDGYFIHPSPTTADVSSLSEFFIRPADRGAIAVFAPAGWGIVQDHDILARGLFEAIFTQGLNTAGAATTYAKIYLAAHAGGYNSLIDTYILFGDPALQLKLGPSTPPQPGDLGIDLQSDMVGEVQPGDTVEFTLKYKNLGSSYLQQVVVSSDLPVGLTNVTALDTPDIARHSVQPNTWLITSLAPGATGQISFTGQVADGFTGELRVSALGTTTSTEADLFNNNDALAWQGPQTPHRMYYLPLISQEKP